MLSSFLESALRCSRRNYLASTTMRRHISNDLKSYPQYNIFSESCMLSFKILPPHFKFNRPSNSLSVDQTRKGRILLEWVRRNPNGGISRDQASVVRFGLSPEEVGLLLYQIPQHNTVELIRKPNQNEGFLEGGSAPYKVFRVVPDPNVATVEFIADFEQDGVGGQELQGVQGPFAAKAQAGEVQVILEIMRSSLPSLVGWSTSMDVAIQRAVDDALSGVSKGYGSGGQPRQSDDY